MNYIRPYMPEQPADCWKSERQYIEDFYMVHTMRLLDKYYKPLKDHTLLKKPQAEWDEPLIPIPIKPDVKPPVKHGASGVRKPKPKKPYPYVPTGRPRGRPPGTTRKPAA